jgi:hypothetical protein
MIINVKDFGAIGDGYNDDSDAFQAALDSMKPSAGMRDAKGGGVLLVPAGNYYLTKTLWINHRVEIVGITGAEGQNIIRYTFYDNSDGTCDSLGNLPANVSRLMFKRGVTGIRVAYGGPVTGNGGISYMDNAVGTILRNLTIIGAFNRNPAIGDPLDQSTKSIMWPDPPTNPSEFAHGISVKARVIVENCYIANFKGNGIHIVALTNQENVEAIDFNNSRGLDYASLSSLRKTNNVLLQNGDLYNGKNIIRAPIPRNYDLKHQALGDLNRDNMYLLFVDKAGVIEYQLAQFQANVIGSSFINVSSGYNYLNGFYTIGNNAGNTFLQGVHCHHNFGYGFFDSESSGGNTYLNCQADYNQAEGFYRLYTVIENDDPSKYSKKSLAAHTYINCYQEDNGPGKNIRARVYPHAIIIGGTLADSNNCEPDPDPVFNILPPNILTDLFNDALPAILTQGASYGFAGFPNGITATGGDNPTIVDSEKNLVRIDIGGVSKGTALVLHKLDENKNRVGSVNLAYQEDTHWWAMENNFAKGQNSFCFSTKEATEGPNKFWLPNGFFIGAHPNRNQFVSLNYDNGVLTEDISKHRIGDIIFNDAPVFGDPKRGFAGYMLVNINGELKWAGFGKLENLE